MAHEIGPKHVGEHFSRPGGDPGLPVGFRTRRVIRVEAIEKRLQTAMVLYDNA